MRDRLALTERFRLYRVKLRLIDGSAIEKLLGFFNFACRPARNGPNVLVELTLRGLYLFHASVPHAIVEYDEIDENAEPREDDDDDDPEGFDPAGHVVTA